MNLQSTGSQSYRTYLPFIIHNGTFNDKQSAQHKVCSLQEGDEMLTWQIYLRCVAFIITSPSSSSRTECANILRYHPLKQPNICRLQIYAEKCICRVVAGLSLSSRNCRSLIICFAQLFNLQTTILLRLLPKFTRQPN